MRITIIASVRDAVRIGRNSSEWISEIDVSMLTPEQRDALSTELNNKTSLDFSSNAVNHDTGEITASSISFAVEKMIERFEKNYQQAVKLVDDYDTGKETWPPYSHVIYQDLPERLRLPLKDRIEVIRKRREAKDMEEKTKKEAVIAAWDNKYLPLIESYEAGGDRPNWAPDRWRGSSDLLDRIVYEDRRRNEAEEKACEARKHLQLTGVVDKYGSELQKEKWTSGLMARSEALNVLWHTTFKAVCDFNIVDGSDYLLGCGDCDHTVSDKRTLTDDQFSNLKTIKDKLGDGWSCEIKVDHVESCSDCCFGDTSVVYVTVSKQVGEYELSANISLN